MTQFLLDTNVLSEPTKPKPNRAVIDGLRIHGDGCFTSAIVWYELVFGVMRLPPGQRRANLRAYLDEAVAAALPILPVDDEVAFWLAETRAEHQRAGITRPLPDSMIAGTAVINNLVLVTRDIKDFTGFPGLRVTSWHG